MYWCASKDGARVHGHALSSLTEWRTGKPDDPGLHGRQHGVRGFRCAGGADLAFQSTSLTAAASRGVQMSSHQTGQWEAGFEVNPTNTMSTAA